eukprot:TRINITY_DN43958_c0_g1_i1.p1 TRINITY_DN43958_c0_g1~~TRINITY_DN43958_c0_g1_i1.p1  ORF type:complete len:288 (-),score=49.72 TRINITY_DN43958_c0_g1_i1:57-920(-)
MSAQLALAPVTDWSQSPRRSAYGDSEFSPVQSTMQSLTAAPNSPARQAGKLLLKRLEHPCLTTLPGFSDYFDKPTFHERYPPFNCLTPREKAQSPRMPGALHQMYREPEVSHGHRKRWLAGLPHNEKLLRHELDRKFPGSPDMLLSARSTASEGPPPLPQEEIVRHRTEHAAKLETLIRKVAPSKDSDAPIIVAAKRRLQRLREPTMPSQAAEGQQTSVPLEELCSCMDRSSKDDIALACASLDEMQRKRIQAAVDAQLVAMSHPISADPGHLEDALQSWQSQNGDS